MAMMLCPECQGTGDVVLSQVYGWLVVPCSSCEGVGSVPEIEEDPSTPDVAPA